MPVDAGHGGCWQFPLAALGSDEGRSRARSPAAATVLPHRQTPGLVPKPQGVDDAGQVAEQSQENPSKRGADQSQVSNTHKGTRYFSCTQSKLLIAGTTRGSRTPDPIAELHRRAASQPRRRRSCTACARTASRRVARPPAGFHSAVRPKICVPPPPARGTRPTATWRANSSPRHQRCGPIR